MQFLSFRMTLSEDEQEKKSQQKLEELMKHVSMLTFSDKSSSTHYLTWLARPVSAVLFQG